jgi:hypothetical protein
MPVPSRRPAAIALSAACLALASGAIATAPRPLHGPEPPPAFRGPDATPRPLDRRLAEDPVGVLQGAPDGWCPSGPDFQRWLESRLAPSARSGRAKAGGPAITWTDNIVLMEDDGSLMRHDRRPDLEGRSLELIPSGDDYTARLVPDAYETDAGTQVLFDQRGWAEAPVTLAAMTFPFGGTPRSQLWMTSAFTASFVDPAAPGPAQLHLNDLIADRSPRIAPLQQGSSLGGWNAFVREEADRVVLTWKAAEGGWYDVDVQAILFADGRIVMSWRRLRGVQHGSVVVIDGDAAWWADRSPGGSATSAPDEVGVPAPDGPAADILEVSGHQVGGSEILQLELLLQAPLPADTDGTLQYVFEIRDEPGGPVLWAVWFEWQDGRWNWTYAPAEVLPSGFRFNVNRTGLNLTDDDIEVVAWSATSWSWQQAVTAIVSWPTPPVPLMRDFSAIGPETLRGPLAEAFTLPELDVYAVHAAYAARFGAPALDGLAIYQNFNTDIVFYAGAYSTVGNAGADGIGAGNTTDPKSPALLHMSTIRQGWSSWDQGKVTVLNHEFGHHWLYFYSMIEGGTPTKSCGDGHPAGWTHAPAATPVFNAWDASCMGGSSWTDNADGTFTSSPGFASFGYSWHELYLMGLAEPSEVPDWFYLRDSVPALPGAYWPPDNTTATATRVDVTLQQVVDAMGPRVPAAPDSQRDFIVPMVLIVRPGEYSQDDVDEVERTCQVWRTQFNVATVGRGTVTCDRIGDRPPVVDITVPGTDVTIPEGTTLAVTGTGTDPDLDAVTVEWDLESLGGLVPGEGPHDVTFAEPGTYTITLTGRDATGRDAVPVSRRITVECVAPPEMPILRVAHDRAVSLTFTLDAGAPVADEHVVGTATTLPPAFVEAGAGALPLTLPQPPDDLVFYRLAGRNLPDCLGTW